MVVQKTQDHLMKQDATAVDPSKLTALTPEVVRFGPICAVLSMRRRRRRRQQQNDDISDVKRWEFEKMISSVNFLLFLYFSHVLCFALVV